MTRRCLIFSLLGLAFIIVTPGISLADFKLFIHVDGIEGESIDANHRNWIDGISYAGEIVTDGDRVCFKDIKITKYFDKSSPILSFRAASGLIVPEVRFDFCRNTPGGERFLLIEIENVRITSISSAASVAGAEPTPLEEVGFAFERIKWFYYPPEGGSLVESFNNVTRCDDPIDQ